MSEIVVRKHAYIDALRGCAILGVILVHSSQAVAPLSSTLQQFMSTGARGVQLFYIASAVTLCMSWELRNTQEQSPIRNYFLRRIFRIAPMFYIAIGFYVCLYGLGPRTWAPDGIKWWYVPLTAVFLHGFHPETITSVVPGGWSIAVEMNFYLLLPFLLCRLKSTKSFLLFFIFSTGLCVVSRFTIQKLFQGHYSEEYQYLVDSFTMLNFVGQLPVFALGILAFRFLKDTHSLKRFVIVGNVLLAALIASLLSFPEVNLVRALVVRILFNYLVMSLILALFALTLACYPTRFIVNPVFTQLGKISFSMYLSHFAVLELLSRCGISSRFPTGDLSSILHFVCVVIATATVSWILYASIEKRGVWLGKLLIERLEKRVA